MLTLFISVCGRGWWYWIMAFRVCNRGRWRWIIIAFSMCSRGGWCWIMAPNCFPWFIHCSKIARSWCLDKMPPVSTCSSPLISGLSKHCLQLLEQPFWSHSAYVLIHLAVGWGPHILSMLTMEALLDMQSKKCVQHPIGWKFLTTIIQLTGHSSSQPWFSHLFAELLTLVAGIVQDETTEKSYAI